MEWRIWGRGKGKTYRYHFGGIAGFIKFLFAKKICRKCSGKLKRNSEKVYAGKMQTKYSEYAVDTYDVTVLYKCEDCEAVFSPKDL